MGRAANLLVLLVGYLLTAPMTDHALAQTVHYREAPLRQVIEEVARLHGYRVLYRDDLIQNRFISLNATHDNVLTVLSKELVHLGLNVEADTARGVLLLTKAPDRQVLIEGSVQAADTGEPLPFATITWEEFGSERGTMTGKEGGFSIRLHTGASQDTVVLRASYVGFNPSTIALNVMKGDVSSISFKLQPQIHSLPAVLVEGSAIWLDGVDSTWHRIVRPGHNAPFGERSIIGALKSLPSVGLISGFQGLNVRGSPSDGFQVLLDGVPVYHPAHLFGLFDAFSPEALHAVGFYYDVAPSYYSAPPGGTLALRTRDERPPSLKTVAGFSNAAARLVFQGPLGKYGSLTIAGRRSIIDLLNWPGNEDIIAYGLDVGRPTGPLPEKVTQVETRLLKRGPSLASFYDFHAKLAFTWPRFKLAISNYVGGDEARQQAQRLMPVPNLQGEGSFGWKDVATEQDWTNKTASVNLLYKLDNSVSLQSLLATSHYESGYSKDDFLYTFSEGNIQALFRRIEPFYYSNALGEWRWEQSLQKGSHQGYWKTGYSIRYLHANYREVSAFRQFPFMEEQHAYQIDAFIHQERLIHDKIHISTGTRLHAYTTGRHIRVSPRAQITWHPNNYLSTGIGVSRNYQFIHHVAFENLTSTGVWLLTGKHNPTAVDHVSAGMQIRSRSARVQVSIYNRRFSNVWQHEITAPFFLINRDHDSAPPWLTGARGRSYGIEFMFDKKINKMITTLAYTLSRVDLAHDALDNGTWYAAPWDRRHQLKGVLEILLYNHNYLNIAWISATGSPNTEYLIDQGQSYRLGAYHRLDASFRAHFSILNLPLEARAAIFNLFDRSNPSYRTQILVLAEGKVPRRLTFAPVDVYDMGRQVSFEVVINL